MQHVVLICLLAHCLLQGSCLYYYTQVVSYYHQTYDQCSFFLDVLADLDFFEALNVLVWILFFLKVRCWIFSLFLDRLDCPPPVPVFVQRTPWALFFPLDFFTFLKLTLFGKGSDPSESKELAACGLKLLSGSSEHSSDKLSSQLSLANQPSFCSLAPFVRSQRGYLCPGPDGLSLNTM